MGTKDDPSGLSTFTPFAAPCPDQFALEFGETAQIKRPCAVVVSAQISLSDLRPADGPERMLRR